MLLPTTICTPGLPDLDVSTSGVRAVYADRTVTYATGTLEEAARDLGLDVDDLHDACLPAIYADRKSEILACAPIYHRERHAAHYGDDGAGHDLETWSFPDAASVRADQIPSGAEYHNGFCAADGRLYAVYARRAPLTGAPCARCQSNGAC